MPDINPQKLAIVHVCTRQYARIMVLSDLHLAHPRSAAGDLGFLKQLITQCDLLILNGDISESRRRSHYLPEAEVQLRRLHALLEESGVDWLQLAGNHDPDTAARVAVIARQIVVTHGDMLYAKASPWGREYLFNKTAVKNCIQAQPNWNDDLHARIKTACCVANAVQPYEKPESKKKGLYKTLRYIFWPPERPLAVLHAWWKMPLLCAQFSRKFFPECHSIICGHFHKTGHWQRRGIDVYNSGAMFSFADAQALLVTNAEGSRKLQVKCMAIDLSADSTMRK